MHRVNPTGEAETYCICSMRIALFKLTADHECSRLTVWASLLVLMLIHCLLFVFWVQWQNCIPPTFDWIQEINKVPYGFKTHYCGLKLSHQCVKQMNWTHGDSSICLSWESKKIKLCIVPQDHAQCSKTSECIKEHLIRCKSHCKNKSHSALHLLAFFHMVSSYVLIRQSYISQASVHPWKWRIKVLNSVTTKYAICFHKLYCNSSIS